MEFANYPSLKGKTVFITGGATGIGADLVRAFAGQGARVGFVDLQDGPAEQLVSECGGDLVYRHCDVTDIDALGRVLDEVAAQLGPVAILVNNAANDKREAVEDVSVNDWDLAQNINLRPHFFAAQMVRGGMKAAGGGAIVNLSSIAWRLGMPGMAPYVTAKAAVVGLTNALAAELGPDNIRVNAIEPGAVMTPRQRQLWYPTESSVQKMVEAQFLRVPLLGDEIARAALFLASDDARMITKQSLAVNGGMQ